MPRRVSLPGASELFRPTHDFDAPPSRRAWRRSSVGRGGRRTKGRPADPAGSGTTRRSRCTSSADELLALERARLELRARHGLAVDRGRIVREAIAAMLADFEAAGEELPARPEAVDVVIVEWSAKSSHWALPSRCAARRIGGGREAVASGCISTTSRDRSTCCCS